MCELREALKRLSGKAGVRKQNLKRMKAAVKSYRVVLRKSLRGKTLRPNRQVSEVVFVGQLVRTEARIKLEPCLAQYALAFDDALKEFSFR